MIKENTKATTLVLHGRKGPVSEHSRIDLTAEPGRSHRSIKKPEGNLATARNEAGAVGSGIVKY
ncbi:rCG25526 [Rattus norvegicus]|uniref:RCG25526 n=1 Tax=Rattus norvegicus TaxID=10116 RepID=A6I2A7_RAT|nr:rCG25526 [Rattus norvegicus]